MIQSIVQFNFEFYSKALVEGSHQLSLKLARESEISVISSVVRLLVISFGT